MDEAELQMRRMRYRLNRQGMLELDAWLAPILKVDFDDPEIVDAVQLLLDCEAPELQRMMHGELSVPDILKPWLGCP
ncbi:MAG: succinate dehydrogenase assembly factor 2 [Mariprofundaceae bacterium]